MSAYSASRRDRSHDAQPFGAPRERAQRIRARLLRMVFSAAVVAAAVQVGLRLVAVAGIDHATRCVYLAGRLARAGIALAIVSVSPDCPAEEVTPGGDFAALMVWLLIGAACIGLIYAGTSARAARACRFAAALSRGEIWRRLLALADTPSGICGPRRASYREPATRTRLVRCEPCGMRGPPLCA
ncbi:hypothetical protein [Spelaeicoccus albus]|uniref:Uncharacterized protein n=1 Tax=Spelaeicoccus albus TaxID=1280376 RepID=A0A7Z0A7T0_9MICO|nr:hypothetical protein [Spelaeicoccus albus]NYI65957.1 hypothetical protein [Spelaeicoccus albus]